MTRLPWLLKTVKATRGAGIPKDLIGRMPGILKNPSAIFWDKQDPALLYVFDIPGDARKGKFVVRVDYATKAKLPGQSKSKSITGNFVRTGGVVDPNNLRAKRYLPITED